MTKERLARPSLIDLVLPVKKINDMRDKLAKKLADPALYEDGKAGELATWNKKYAEVMEANDRAETMWMTALEKLEKAQNA